MSDGGWESLVRSHFPGYLLPSSRVLAITAEEAGRFLERITGRKHEFQLLRAASTLAPRISELRAFSTTLLPDLARNLPSRSDITTRDWRGGFQGRLDVRRTITHRISGDPGRFSTSARQRSFGLPENILVRCVAERLRELLVDLRQGKMLEKHGWSEGAQDCEGALKQALTSTELRHVPKERLTPEHERAAHGAVHPCYKAALAWHLALRDGLDVDDPKAIAAQLAAGALVPLEDHRRFEIAVLIRLLQGLWNSLEHARGGGFVFHRCLIRSDRKEVALFEHPNGSRLRVYYDQAHLDAGACEDGAKHYLAHEGRMRPDITIVVEKDGKRRAAVIEVKLSEKSDYLLSGLHEAMLYRWEYAADLHGWPKAILVASANVPGAPRTTDDVIAVGWKQWIPDVVVAGLLDGIVE